MGGRRGGGEGVSSWANALTHHFSMSQMNGRISSWFNALADRSAAKEVRK